MKIRIFALLFALIAMPLYAGESPQKPALPHPDDEEMPLVVTVICHANPQSINTYVFRKKNGDKKIVLFQIGDYEIATLKTSGKETFFKKDGAEWKIISANDMVNLEKEILQKFSGLLDMSVNCGSEIRKL